jgi:plastocyanin
MIRNRMYLIGGGLLCLALAGVLLGLHSIGGSSAPVAVKEEQGAPRTDPLSTTSQNTSTLPSSPAMKTSGPVNSTGAPGSGQPRHGGTTLEQEVISHDGGPLSTTRDPMTGEEVYVIELGDNGFRPSRMTVLTGTTFVIRNVGSVDHSWTNDDWDSGRLVPGATSEITFATPGTYTFPDAFHPQVTSTVTVQSPSS